VNRRLATLFGVVLALTTLVPSLAQQSTSGAESTVLPKRLVGEARMETIQSSSRPPRPFRAEIEVHESNSAKLVWDVRNCPEVKFNEVHYDGKTLRLVGATPQTCADASPFYYKTGGQIVVEVVFDGKEGKGLFTSTAPDRAVVAQIAMSLTR
jgi:hypothetical protein